MTRELSHIEWSEIRRRSHDASRSKILNEVTRACDEGNAFIASSFLYAFVLFREINSLSSYRAKLHSPYVFTKTPNFFSCNAAWAFSRQKHVQGGEEYFSSCVDIYIKSHVNSETFVWMAEITFKFWSLVQLSCFQLKILSQVIFQKKKMCFNFVNYAQDIS